MPDESAPNKVIVEKAGNTNTKKTGLTHRTLVGFFWSFSGTGAQAVLQFLVLAILSRLITPAEFGLVNIANIITVFAAIFYQVGLGPSLIQRKTITDDHIRSSYTLSLILSVALTAITWVLAPSFSSVFEMDGLTEVIRGMSFLFFINGLGLVARSLNHRNLNFRIKARFNVTSYVVGYGVVGVAMAFLGYGVWALVWASLVQSAVASLLFINATPHAKRPQLNWPALSGLLSFGVGNSLGKIFNRIASTADNLVVGATLGATAVGFYGRAFQLMVLPSTYFGQVLDTVLFTSMSKVQDKPQTLGVVYRRGVVAIALLVLPLSAFMFVLAPEVILVLFGDQWDAVVVPFQIFAFTMLFRTSYKMSDSLSRASGAVYRRALVQFVFSILIVAGAWIGHFWGIAGVALGVSVAITFNFFSMARLSLQITQMSWSSYARLHLPPLFLGVVTLALTWGVAALLRGLELPSVVTLGGSMLIVGTSLGLLVWGFPQRLLGSEGMWIVQTMIGYLPGGLKRRLLKVQPQ